jgi:hypothetical protein
MVGNLIARNRQGQRACGSGDARQDFRENPGLSNHNSARLAMRLRIAIMRQSAYAADDRRLSNFGLKRASFLPSVRA